MEYLSKIYNCPLFDGMAEADINKIICSDKARVFECPKDGFVFRQGESPERLNLLLEGSVTIGNNSNSGERSVIAVINSPGEMFGDVYLFLDKEDYDHFAQATEPSKVLQLSKELFFCEEVYKEFPRLTTNMMLILAKKAYFLNRRLQVTSCIGIRKKLAKLLVQHYSSCVGKAFSMNKEDLAAYIAAARPSVSRELIKMKNEGLVKMEGKYILVPDINRLKDII